LYLGEIRDCETGLVARQVAESGHSVYTTTHARSSLGIMDRFSSPAIGVPRDVLATPEIVKLLVYQALLPVSCPDCSKSPNDHAIEAKLHGKELNDHKVYFERLERLYGIDSSRYRLRDHNGCPKCRKEELPELNGFKGRTVVAEMVEPDEQMLSHVLTGNNIELNRYWRSLATPRFDDENLVGKTTMECAIYKSVHGLIDPREIEPRFMSFETVEAKRKGSKPAAGKSTVHDNILRVA
jgi:type II secretory ATPase GspE/PulE/Tfp pilus assembly ATPase PilB-like protein